MDFEFAAEHEGFRKELRDWLAKNLSADLCLDDASDDRVASDRETFERRRAWQRVMHAAGWVGITWPREYGGRDAGLIERVIWDEEYTAARAPVLPGNMGLNLVGPTLIHWGTDAQKRRHLPAILNADEIWCQGFSEPGAGSDLASLRTRAEDTGDHFIINGQKIWTSGGHIADWGILLARTDPGVPKHKGISCFLFNMRQPGVEVRPLKQITGSSEFNEVFMTNARAERNDLIGRLGQGWEIAQTTLGFERGGNSMARVTRYASAFDHLVEASKKLSRGGRPLLDDPVVRAKLGRVYAEMEVQRYAALRVLSALQKGDSPGAASSITKLSYSEFEKRYYELCLEILGPYGQVTDGGLEETTLDVDSSSGVRSSWAYAFLWARAGTIYSGSSEIQKNVIGERVLGLPKEIRADRVKA